MKKIMAKIIIKCLSCGEEYQFYSDKFIQPDLSYVLGEMPNIDFCEVKTDDIVIIISECAVEFSMIRR